MVGSTGARMQPSESLKRRADIMYANRDLGTKSVPGVANDIVMIDALSSAINDGIVALRTIDGRIDERDVGAFVLRRMIDSGGALSFMPSIIGVTDAAVQESIIDKVAPVFGKMISKAIERRWRWRWRWHEPWTWWRGRLGWSRLRHRDHVVTGALGG
jgi:hypothetical protein